MSLTLPSPPQAALGILQKALATFGPRLAVGGGSFDQLRPVVPLSFRVSDPHQVYTVGLRDVYNGSVVAGAKPTGWRYLLFDDDAVIGTAELHGSRNDLRFGRVSRGNDPFAEGTLQALQRALVESSPEVDCEFRLLKAPALTLLCAWMHGANDRFIPIDPVPAEVEPGKVYEERDLANSLHNRASVLLKFDALEEARNEDKSNKAPPDDLNQV